jgi:hypothetical protein
MPSPEKPGRPARRAALAIAAVAVVAAGLALAFWTRPPRAPAATHTVPPGPAVPAPPVAPNPGPDAGRAPAAGPSAAEAPLPQEVFTAIANWAARLGVCPLAAARAPRAHAVIRFELTPDLRVASARLVDPATSADLSDDCSRAALGAPRTLDGGGPPLTVWWPLGSAPPDGGAAVAAVDAGEGGVAPAPPKQLPGGGVDLLIVPYFHPLASLPKGAFARPWLGLCGPEIDRATPRVVTLTSRPNEENSDFVDVSVRGCGHRGPAEVVAFRGANVAASIGTQPAHFHAIPDSPIAETEVSFGGERYRLWQLRAGRPEGILALRAGATVQVLAADEDPEWNYALTWAGDLDRDGRLDLIVRDGEPDQARYRLYLSGGKRLLPVQLAAESQMPGD